MGRLYTQLKCGCLISCDGGGGLISCDNIPDDCDAWKYVEEHKMVGGYCKICHPNEYKKEVGTN